MKSCYCPNCGEKQTCKLGVGGSAKVHCRKCARSLLFKRSSCGVAVKANDPNTPKDRSA